MNTLKLIIIIYIEFSLKKMENKHYMTRVFLNPKKLQRKILKIQLLIKKIYFYFIKILIEKK